MRGLNWQTLHVPLGLGRNGDADERALQPPELARATDVQFDSEGGLQTRYPYAALGANVYGGGTLSNVRKIIANGSELLCFTADALYSWNPTIAKWVSKGTHLAVKVDEANRFVSGRDQYDCDRAELNGTIVYCWTESVNGGSIGYVAAIDSTTASVLLAPTALPNSAARLRVTALATKILLTYDTTAGALYAYAIDPAAPAISGGATLTNTNFGNAYDVIRIPGADQAAFVTRRSPNTSYTLGTVTAGLTVATTSKARGCQGAIALASPPDGKYLQVVRSNYPDVHGDYIEISGWADVATNQALGTCDADCDQIAAAYRSTLDGGTHRCYAFWSALRTTDGITSWLSKANWVDTAGTLGTQANFIRRLDVASRAFDHNGRIYVWLAFSGATGTYGLGANLQNTLFLYRDDGFLVAKAASNRASGFLSQGYLPGVQSLGAGAFAVCATERTIFGERAPGRQYTGRRPRDVTFAFDANEARRTARLGRTLYVAGGEILQYDGEKLVEVGFHQWPWYFNLTTVGGAGSVADGTYGYKLSFRSDNAQADVDRSAAIAISTTTVSGGPKRVDVKDVVPLYVTHKAAASLEVWRTQVNPTDDAPYYLSSTADPSDLTNPNRYLPNDTAAGALPTMQDYLSDASLENLGTYPQDATLPSLSPPAARLIISTDARVFLAGVAGEPDAVYYSKLRGEGEVAAFHGALVAQVPAEGGAITGLGFLNETLIVFRSTAIYVLPGDGYDNTGGGSNYGPARALSTDVGSVNHESIATTDRGLVFKSSKGWFLLNKGWSLEHIGGPVSDFDTYTPLAADVVESQHQIRLLVQAPASSTTRILVLDTLASQRLQRPTWADWSVADGLDSCLWNGTHVYLASAGPRAQAATYAAVDYGVDLETAWIKLNDLQGFGRVRLLEVLGEYRSGHRLRVRLARDYWKDGAATYFQDKTWTVSPSTVGAPEGVAHGPSIQQLAAIKIRITVLGAGSAATPDGEAVRLTGIGLEVGVKPRLRRNLPAAQRQ